MKKSKGLLLLFFLTVLRPGVANDSLPLPVASALGYRDIPPEALSIYVEHVVSGETVLEWNAEVSRNPASVEKMVTTLVALDQLGPTYRWKTEVFTNGDIDGGTLEGDLLLKGYGDPYLVTERYWQLLRQIRALGIDTIAGNLLLDDSHFDVGYYDPGAFDREPLRAYNVAPNALLTNFKVVRYFFEPDPASNRVQVRLDPYLDNIEIDNRLRVAAGACRGYQRGIAITPEEDFRRIVFSGRFPSGCEVYAMDRTALSHNEFTYGLFRSLWRQLGGTFDGGWENVVVEEDREADLVFDSPPLAEVIAKVNKYSNNVMAKQLLHTIAAEAYGPPGTQQKGRRFVSEWLAERGMDFEEFILENGAGLSRESRMTASHLGAMLRYAYESPFMPEYVASLSLSGLDGTLSRRFRDSELAGLAHMKTGSLDHVSSVAGFFQSASGERYIVVAILNHTDVHRGPGSRGSGNVAALAQRSLARLHRRQFATAFAR